MTPDEFRATLRNLSLTQRALCAHLGLAQSTVSHWSTGRVPIPRYAVAYLEAIAYLDKLTNPKQENP